MGVRWIVAFLLATCLAPTQAAQAADRAAVGCYRLESHADQRDCLEALAAETTQLVEKLGGKALADVTEWDQEASYRGRTQTYLRKSIGAFAEGKSAECELQASLAAGGNAASDRRLICQIDMNERRISELLAIDATLLEGDAAALLIRVRRGIYEAGGKSFGSAADLEGMLRERRPTKVRVLPEPGAQYRDVAGVMTAIQHVGGIDVGLVGSKTPE
jgi:uncharacterized protein YecT (DUF1311 family)